MPAKRKTSPTKRGSTMSARKISKSKKRNLFGRITFKNRGVLVAFIVLFAAIGVYLVLASRAATPAAHAQTSIYPQHVNEDGIARFGAIENWLGRDVPRLLQFGQRRTFDGFRNNNTGIFSSTNLGQYKAQGKNPPFQVIYSVPLGFGGFSETQQHWINEYDKIINNTDGYRAEYQRLAQLMKDKGYGNAIIRLDWEFDLGHGSKQRASASPEKFKQAWRIVHGIFRSVSADYKFDYNFIARNVSLPLIEQAYPGNEYVDIIGADNYDRGFNSSLFCTAKAGWCDPEKVWSQYMVPERLQPHLEFAKSKGKQISFPEWGVEAAGGTGGIEGSMQVGGDNPRYIRGMAEWMNALPTSGGGSLAYHAYFWAQPSGEGSHELFEGFNPGVSDVPKSRDEFKKWFGGTPTVVTDTTAPTAPTGLAASNVTANSVQLNWGASTDNNGVAGYDVYRGATRIISTSNLSYTDSNLSAGTSYTYSVKARDAAGNVSAASNTVTVATANAATPADLIVTDVSWSPGSPSSGNGITFSATIKNTGGTATQSGVAHGVSFRVNGSAVSWSDNSTSSLAAGASRTVTANSFRDGNGIWENVAAGTYNVEAVVDDVNRISESNEGNNAKTESLVVANNLEAQKPTLPGSLTVGSIKTGYAKLSWKASSHVTGISHYKILVGGQFRKNVTETTTGIYNLSKSTVYTASVVAVSNNGLESDPASVTFKTASRCVLNICSGQAVY